MRGYESASLGLSIGDRGSTGMDEKLGGLANLFIIT